MEKLFKIMEEFQRITDVKGYYFEELELFVFLTGVQLSNYDHDNETLLDENDDLLSCVHFAML